MFVGYHLEIGYEGKLTYRKSQPTWYTNSERRGISTQILTRIVLDLASIIYPLFILLVSVLSGPPKRTK